MATASPPTRLCLLPAIVLSTLSPALCSDARRLPLRRVPRRSGQRPAPNFEPFARTGGGFGIVGTVEELPAWLPAVWRAALATRPEEQLAATAFLEPATTALELSREVSIENLDAASTELIRLRDVFGNIYTMEVEVGTPPVKMQLAVDTGSSDLWLLEEGYKHRESSTASVLGLPRQSMNYVKGQVSGDEVEDRVCLAGVCLEHQAFTAVSHTSGLPPAFSSMFKGLLGLGFPAATQIHGAGKTVVESLAQEGPWKHFSFGLCVHGSADGHGSFLVLGGAADVTAEGRHCEVQGPGATLPVVDVNQEPRLWMSMGQLAFSVGGQQILNSALVPMLLDSGTSFVMVPTAIYPLIMKYLMPLESGLRCGVLLGQPACPCDVALSDMTLTFPGENGLLMTVTLDRNDLLRPAAAAQVNGMQQDICMLTVQPSAMPMVILGDVFFRHVYAVHDVEKRQVTLFAQRGASNAAPSSNGFTFDGHPKSQGVVMAGVAFAAMAFLSVLAVTLLRCQPSTYRENEGYMQL